MRFPYKVAGGLALAAGVGAAAAGVAVALAGREAYRIFRLADISGDVALITGGSRGLGLALAEEFARCGCKLVICARDPQELEQARQRLEANFGVEVLAVTCDVSDREQVEQMVDRATERFGGIDILVNNAGIITVGPLATQALEDFERSMDTIFWGTVYPTLAILPQMLERQEGRIANITSIGGRISVPHLLPYNCAKFAAVGFSEGLRAELAKEKIRVTTVVPGLMRTGSYKNAEMKGKHKAEYAWFALSSSLPLMTIGAERAARRIVNAIRRGSAEIILTPQAQLAALAHGVFPGLTADILGLVNRALPGADGAGLEARTGKESQSAVTESFLTRMGERAAEKYQHQSKDGSANSGKPKKIAAATAKRKRRTISTRPEENLAT